MHAYLVPFGRPSKTMQCTFLNDRLCGQRSIKREQMLYNISACIFIRRVKGRHTYTQPNIHTWKLSQGWFVAQVTLACHLHGISACRFIRRVKGRPTYTQTHIVCADILLSTPHSFIYVPTQRALDATISSSRST